jgi:hypothetical protein
MTVGRSGFEIKEVEHGEAFKCAASRDRLVAGLIARTGATRTLSDVESGAEACAIELIGKLGALERKPANDVRAECESKSVRVPRGQAARSNR